MRQATFGSACTWVSSRAWALLVAGLLVLPCALNVQHGPAAWTGRLGSAAAAAALALYGALQAVDGVALKHAVDAWAKAPDAEKAMRFAAAEDIRWMEWGVRSYQSVMLGIALILFGIAITTVRTVPRPVAYLMALSGVAYVAQGWVIGTEGFSTSNKLPTLAGIALILAWTGWLQVIAWRMKGPAGGQRSRTS